jgi:hypothetical protein
MRATPESAREQSKRPGRMAPRVGNAATPRPSLGRSARPRSWGSRYRCPSPQPPRRPRGGEIPCTYASITTAYRAWSIRRRGLRMLGKKLPLRSFDPQLYVPGRDLLRSVLRSLDRSYPLTAAEASPRDAVKRSCRELATQARFRSVPGPSQPSCGGMDRSSGPRGLSCRVTKCSSISCSAGFGASRGRGAGRDRRG